MVGRVIESGSILKQAAEPVSEVKVTAIKPVTVTETRSRNQAERFISYTPAVMGLVGSAGIRLRQVRESFGLSRPAMAARLHMPQTSLKNYELGYRTLGIECLLALREFSGDHFMLYVMTGVLSPEAQHDMETGLNATAYETLAVKIGNK